MAIGYACLTKSVPSTDYRHCLLGRADRATLSEVSAYNLDHLSHAVSYAIDHAVGLFRISSDIVPFASKPGIYPEWKEDNRYRLAAIGALAREGGLRLSMHPGQYTVLDSPHPAVVENSIAELRYHADLLDSMGLDRSHKIILHIGGTYGEKEEATKRFCDRYRQLDRTIRDRLVLENDERSFTIADVLAIAETVGSPVVFDNLHHSINGPELRRSPRQWIERCATTWKPEDGRQKIHYSQQDPDKHAGAHSPTIRIGPFLDFRSEIEDLDCDIMLEVKDKNISALKCINCTTWPLEETVLWEEWGRYRLAVSERSLEAILQIPSMLEYQDRSTARAFYERLEQVLERKQERSQVLSTVRQVYDLYTELFTRKERARFERVLADYGHATVDQDTVKRALGRLCEIYDIGEVLTSYYYLQ
jgi:UV DNA damage endonuclease